MKMGKINAAWRTIWILFFCVTPKQLSAMNLDMLYWKAQLNDQKAFETLIRCLHLLQHLQTPETPVFVTGSHSKVFSRSDQFCQKGKLKLLVKMTQHGKKSLKMILASTCHMHLPLHLPAPSFRLLRLRDHLNIILQHQNVALKAPINAGAYRCLGRCKHLLTW